MRCDLLQYAYWLLQSYDCIIQALNLNPDSKLRPTENIGNNFEGNNVI